jgi:GDP/UDP-N,N'-diacetylbacillosamine 2-epimerase (hydrolysing)
MRKICYISGTRADFGLMHEALNAIHMDPGLSLSVIVTGMHLLESYGSTWSEIDQAGLTICDKVLVELSGGTGEEMAIALGQQIGSFSAILSKEKPDLLMLLGDRGEMLAGAIAALHLNIPIVHIHGGELSGTVDEPVRHAISKLSHYHFTATKESRNRLIRMGEKPENIFVTGAPGLDSIYKEEILKPELFLTEYGLDAKKPFLLIVFHPVVQQFDDIARQTKVVLKACIETGMQCFVVMPNSDAGGSIITEVIKKISAQEKISVAVHVPRKHFLSLIANAEVMIGNSSSGIIEAASLGTPVVNIGDRQKCRERNPNVIDVCPVEEEICQAIDKAKLMKGQVWVNVYGDGSASKKIIEHLKYLSLNSKILEKVNAY